MRGEIRGEMLPSLANCPLPQRKPSVNAWEAMVPRVVTRPSMGLGRDSCGTGRFQSYTDSARRGIPSFRIPLPVHFGGGVAGGDTRGGLLWKIKRIPKEHRLLGFRTPQLRGTSGDRWFTRQLKHNPLFRDTAVPDSAPPDRSAAALFYTLYCLHLPKYRQR